MPGPLLLETQMPRKLMPAEPYDVEFDPATSALLIIDMQRDFVMPGGFGEALGNDVAQLWSTVDPIRRMLEISRRIGSSRSTSAATSPTKAAAPAAALSRSHARLTWNAGFTSVFLAGSPIIIRVTQPALKSCAGQLPNCLTEVLIERDHDSVAMLLRSARSALPFAYVADNLLIRLDPDNANARMTFARQLVSRGVADEALLLPCHATEVLIAGPESRSVEISDTLVSTGPEKRQFEALASRGAWPVPCVGSGRRVGIAERSQRPDGPRSDQREAESPRLRAATCVDSRRADIEVVADGGRVAMA